MLEDSYARVDNLGESRVTTTTDLPFETWIEILQWVGRMDFAAAYQNVLGMKNTPKHVSWPAVHAVCRRWRVAALICPELWRVVTLDMDFVGPEKCNYVCAMLVRSYDLSIVGCFLNVRVYCYASADGRFDLAVVDSICQRAAAIEWSWAFNPHVALANTHGYRALVGQLEVPAASPIPLHSLVPVNSLAKCGHHLLLLCEHMESLHLYRHGHFSFQHDVQDFSYDLLRACTGVSTLRFSYPSALEDLVGLHTLNPAAVTLGGFNRVWVNVAHSWSQCLRVLELPPRWVALGLEAATGPAFSQLIILRGVTARAMHFFGSHSLFPVLKEIWFVIPDKFHARDRTFVARFFAGGIPTLQSIVVKPETGCELLARQAGTLINEMLSQAPEVRHVTLKLMTGLALEWTFMLWAMNLVPTGVCTLSLVRCTVPIEQLCRLLKWRFILDHKGFRRLEVVDCLPIPAISNEADSGEAWQEAGINGGFMMRCSGSQPLSDAKALVGEICERWRE
ncbi:hypothetical protein BKA62DRAFT_675160 [Auriculariales sp. MPI-PUGE-AT-0066]|nr:hypothetical protein BKA62DRAFT_675160 [Auriculariales sp. MPI-PUGE-AT-0066]